ncbi:unnamed protein product, partial [Meganyctiphanes norvegica]
MANNLMGRRGIKNSVHITTHPDYIMERRSGRVHKPTEKFKGFLTRIGSHSLIKRGERTNRDVSVASHKEKNNIILDESLSILSKSHLDKNVLEDLTEEILNQDEALKSDNENICNPTYVSCVVDENDATHGKEKKRKDTDSSYRDTNL